MTFAVAAVVVFHRHVVRLLRCVGDLFQTMPDRRSESPADAEVRFTELVSMAMTAGHGFRAAVDRAAAAVGGEVGRQAAGTLRRGQSGDPALAVFRVASRALSTGAPLAPSIEAVSSRLRAEAMERRRAAGRRLPVRLLFPLTLLILPGTVLLTLGPVLLGALDRFSY